MRASGRFDVKITPRAPDADGEAGADGAVIGRLAIAKQFHGGLEAESRGQMLAMRAPVDGSAGYVALEQVRGTLDGKRGAFVLQHSGLMDRGAATLVVTVVPDSGTDELVGLRGTMTIVVGGGEHAYDFDYELIAASASA